MQKKITPKPRTLSQPRPIQDYLLSKSRAKPSKPNPSESLYSDAKSRELKNQSLQKSVNPNRFKPISKKPQTIQTSPTNPSSSSHKTV